MSKSPGHRQHPDHRVAELRPREHVQAIVAGQVIADSLDVIKLEEDGAPDRYYFPRNDVHMDALEATDTTTRCPFKGTAHYFTVHTDNCDLDDAVWSYEEPFDEHAALKDRVAFYDDKYPEVQVRRV